MSMYKLYGVYNPSGELKMICESSWDAQNVVFDYQDSEFRHKYWKKMNPAWRAAKKLGWKIEIGEYKPTGKFLK